MTLSRRQLLISTLPASAATLGLTPAWAQDRWPAKSLTIIAPNTAGGPADLISRSVTVSLGRELGVPVVVENKAGASGKIGIMAALAAPRDGHTIVLTSITALCALPVFSTNAGYDPLKDLEPLTIAVRTPSVLLTHPSVPVRTMKEFVAYAKARPGQLHYASFGEKSSSHLAFENLLRLLDLNMVHVPYRSEADGRTALASGQVQFMGTSAASKPLVDAGRLIAIAQSNDGPWAAMPGVPAMRDSGVAALSKYEYQPWLGFSVAAGVPAAVRDQPSAALRKALLSPEASGQLQSMGFDVVASTAEEMRRVVVADIANYKALAASGRVKPE